MTVCFVTIIAFIGSTISCLFWLVQFLFLRCLFCSQWKGLCLFFIVVAKSSSIVVLTLFVLLLADRFCAMLLYFARSIWTVVFMLLVLLLADRFCYFLVFVAMSSSKFAFYVVSFAFGRKVFVCLSLFLLGLVQLSFLRCLFCSRQIGFVMLLYFCSV